MTQQEGTYCTSWPDATWKNHPFTGPSVTSNDCFTLCHTSMTFFLSSLLCTFVRFICNKCDGWWLQIRKKGAELRRHRLIRKHAWSVLWFIQYEITEASCQSLADCCSLCLIISMGIGTRGWTREWTAGRAYFKCTGAAKKSLNSLTLFFSCR